MEISKDQSESSVAICTCSIAFSLGFWFHFFHWGKEWSILAIVRAEFFVATGIRNTFCWYRCFRVCQSLQFWNRLCHWELHLFLLRLRFQNLLQVTPLLSSQLQCWYRGFWLLLMLLVVSLCYFPEALYRLEALASHRRFTFSAHLFLVDFHSTLVWLSYHFPMGVLRHLGTQFYFFLAFLNVSWVPQSSGDLN